MKLCIYKVLKELNEGAQPPARSILHSAWIRFSPLPTPALLPSSPCFCFKHSFACSPVHRPRRLLCRSVFHTHTDTQPQACTKKPNTHLESVHKKGEGKKTNKKQARCIHHKCYTLIPVHTAHCTDTMATSPTAP